MQFNFFNSPIEDLPIASREKRASFVRRELRESGKAPEHIMEYFQYMDTCAGLNFLLVSSVETITKMHNFFS